MYSFETVLFILCIFWSSSFVFCELHPYQENYITLPLDHFAFTTDKTFKLRYLINDTFTHGNTDTPILFYCGGEAEIGFFIKETGFVWEFAPKINALVVYAEHRYYGKSLPFRNDSVNNQEHFGYLTIEQALSDFAALIIHLNKGASTNRPTIAIGGSYGGILAALFRMKYPHLVAGALASSAPLKQFSNMTPCDDYSKVITKTFQTAFNEHCSLNVKRSWTVLRDVADEHDGLTFFNNVFNFCEPWKTAYDVNKLLEKLDTVYWHMAMTNYPYNADVYTLLPGNPIREFCSHLDSEYQGRDLVKAFRKALAVYADPYGRKKCFEFPKRVVMQDYEQKAWSFQRCTELLTGECDRGEDDMFPSGGENYTETIKNCESTWGIQVDRAVNKINNHFGIEELKTASKIIFSNGLLDPWSAASVLIAPNDQTLVINIPEGAHHIDLRYSNEKDPPSVTRARVLEELYLKKWIREFRKHISNFM